MHLPTFVAGLVLGPVAGLIVGAGSPMVSSLLTGMPVAPFYMVPMVFELGTYGLVAGLLRPRLEKVLGGGTAIGLDAAAGGGRPYAAVTLSLLGAMIAGSRFRGEFEERLKTAMDEIKQAQGEIILFIDEIHSVVGAGSASGALDASNMLKPALARGELHCIGATTLDEYRKYIEKDGALERRFQMVLVEAPTADPVDDDELPGLPSVPGEPALTPATGDVGADMAIIAMPSPPCCRQVQATAMATCSPRSAGCSARRPPRPARSDCRFPRTSPAMLSRACACWPGSRRNRRA